MKLSKRPLFWVVCSFLWLLAGSADGQTVWRTVTLHYTPAEAEAVTWVWGVDGWKMAPETWWPPGTVSEDAVLHTPMVQQGDIFSIQVQVPADTTLNYGFLVTKGAGETAVFAWEADGSQDYHTLVQHDTTLELHTPLVSQTIDYTAPEAGEVILVWGVNGWQALPGAMQPTDTYLSKGVMYTPMNGQGGTFRAVVEAPMSATIEYGFLTTRQRTGVTVGVWEANGEQDFQGTVGETAVWMHQAKVSAAQAMGAAEPLQPSWYTLVVLGGLILLFSGLKRQIPKREQNTAVQLTALGFTLWVFLLVVRANTLGFHWISLSRSWVLLPLTVVAGYADALYVAGNTIFFVGLVWAGRHHPKIQQTLYAIYAGIALISLVMGLANIQVLYLLGKPATYQLFYYSDFLKSLDVQNTVASHLSGLVVLTLIGSCVALLLAAGCVGHGFALWLLQSRGYKWWLGTAVFFLLYFPLSNYYLEQSHWEPTRLANPITTFTQSVIDLQKQPSLFTMELPNGFTEFEQEVAVEPSPFSSSVPVKNIILLVLESVPAEYVESYGGVYPITPTLSRYRSASIQFQSIYAHAPTSNKSLVSLLGSVYPWISYQTLTQEHPKVEMLTLSSVLHQQGYRTAFIGTGDWRFQRGDEFLARREFDFFQDYNTLACERQTFEGGTEDEPFFDGYDDRCLADRLSQWVAEAPQTPFFAMLWTVNTHYPYFVVGEEVDYGTFDAPLNRYLNAIRHSDELVNDIMRLLQEQGLLESTLVVIVGDHGEAFGRHGQYGHALGVYEENVHVPLIMLNPGLFSGEQSSVVGGHVDVAPTIMHLLGLPSPHQWQGNSLLNTQRNGRTYFYSPWSDMLFGVRDNELKLIINSTTGQTELYDITADPYETTNLASQQPDFVTSGQEYLAGWVQYQEQFMNTLFEASGEQ